MQKFIPVLNTIKRIVLLAINRFLPGCELRSFIISSLHAIWMIVFTLLWLAHINVLDGFDFMNNVMDYRDLLTKKIINIHSGSDIKTKYLLINTSNNNQLLAADNDNQINTVITDRQKLISVLNILNENSERIKYVICDIFFGDTDTIHDYELQKVITLLDQKKKIIIPYFIIENEDHFSFPIFEANRGLSQYRSSFLNSQYLKFSFISYDTLKHIPLITYEDITGKEMHIHHLLGMNYYTLEKKWCLNTIIPEFKYTSYNLIPDSTLYDLGFFTADMIGNNQVVFIGDFEGFRDRHHSMIDEVAGPLIVINALESLIQGDNIIQFHYFLLLFLFFTIISYGTFYKTRIKHYLSKKKKQHIIIDYMCLNINYLFILILTLVSMLFFHHFIHLLILISYFALIELAIVFARVLSKKRNVASN